MAKPYLLGIDVGTSGLKAVVTDSSFRVIATAQAHYTVQGAPGWAELDAEDIWGALVCCADELREKADLRRVRAIGIDCLCPGLVALDEKGRVLQNPILYSDRRSGAEAAQLQGMVSAPELFSITANTMTAGAISVTSMRWFMTNRPQSYEKTRWFGHINTYLLARLTGNVAIDPSNASYTGLFDTVGTRNWSELLCSRFSVDRSLLPPVRESTEVCGVLQNEALLARGIPAGTPVVIGAADTASAAVGCGVLRAGQAFESSGTTEVLSVCVDRPVFSPNLLNRCHAVPGTWLYQCVHSGSSDAMRWGAAMCNLTGEDRYEALSSLAMTQAPGADGALFLPFLGAERCGIWRGLRGGSLLGIAAQQTNGVIARAVLEGCIYAMRELKDLAEKTSGLRFETLTLVGGGSKNRQMTQLRADILNCTYQISKMHHAAPVGAAMMAAVGAGLYPTLDSAASAREAQEAEIIRPRASDREREIYDRTYQKFIKRSACLQAQS